MVLTGVGEKAVKRKGITPLFVGRKANAAQQSAILTFAVEKGDFNATQVNKVQCRASHYEQAVVGIVLPRGCEVINMPALGIHTELTHTREGARGIICAVCQQLSAVGNMAQRTKALLFCFCLNWFYGDQSFAPFVLVSF